MSEWQVLSLAVACGSAQLLPYAYPYASYAYPYAQPYAYPVAAASQYHAQDVLGQASYGYSYPGQAATNFRDAFGNQVGSYAYINPEGKEIRVSYVADANGFRVLSNALPQAPSNDLSAPVFDGVAPQPVQDTAEVAAAKAEFFRLYKEAAAAAEAAPDTDGARKKRQILSYALPVAPAAPLVAKTTVKAAYFEKDDKALTPAATTKIDLKEKEHDVYTPLAYPSFYSAPVVAAPQLIYGRKKRQILSYALPFAPAAPLVAKTTVKTAVYEKNEAALTPAATTKLDLKEQEHDVYTPLAYPYAAPVVAAPAPVVATRVLSSPFVAAPHFGYQIIA